jgi:hypothetical protein
MLTGKGDQYWMTKKYQDNRRKAMEDRTKYNDDKLEDLDVLEEIDLGGGETDYHTYQIKQFPFPIDQSIKTRKKVNLIDVDPRI